MSRAVITKSLLTAIADAIRAKTGKSAAMTPAQMAEEITNIQGQIPDFIVGGTTFPESYTWPYRTMRNMQFARYVGAVQYFNIKEFNCGQLVKIPDKAFCQSVSSSMKETAHNTLTSVIGSNVTKLCEYAFNSCGRLVSATFPNLEEIESNGLSYTALSAANFEKLKKIGSSAFASCDKLSSVRTGSLESIGEYAFSFCTGLTKIKLSGTYPEVRFSCFGQCSYITTIDLDSQSLSTIQSSAFYFCTNLKALIIRRTDDVVTLANTGAFSNSAIASGTGFIYVPDDLVDQYKEATNWVTYANQIKPISEYTEE